jgi:hypothetical protein
MNRKNYVVVLALISVIIVGVTFSIPRGPQPDAVFISNPKFVIADWPYPDEYGQGIQDIYLKWTNGTTYDTLGWFWPYTEFRGLDSEDWFYNTSLVLSVFTWLNATLVGAVSLEDGLNYLKHNITVSLAGETVFSQQNFTYSWSSDYEDPLYVYQHNVTLSCFNTYGGIYTIAIVCEIYGWF